MNRIPRGLAFTALCAFSLIAWMRPLLAKYGSIDHARSFAHALAGAALHECNTVFDRCPESRDKAFLRSLVTWIFERT